MSTSTWRRRLRTLGRLWVATLAAIVATALLALPGGAVGSAGVWTPLPGPAGGLVSDIVPSPGVANDKTVFVALNPGGVFRSRDNGITYERWMTGLTDRRVNALAASRHLPDDGLVLAGTQAGLFKSTNAGATWSQVAGVPQQSVTGVEFSPTFLTSQRAYAAVSGVGVYVSNDRGATWQLGGLGGLTGLDLAGLHLAEGRSGADTLVAWTSNRMFRSCDNAAAWTDIGGGGLPASFIPLSVALSFDFSADRTMVLGTRDNGIWHSTNEGSAWTASTMPDPWPGRVTSVEISHTFGRDNRVFAATSLGGVLRSTDRGVGFGPMNQGLKDVALSRIALSSDFLKFPLVFAGRAAGGVSVSADEGLSWQNVVHGLAGDSVTGIGFSDHFATDGILLATGLNAIGCRHEFDLDIRDLGFESLQRPLHGGAARSRCVV
ncbi:MAG: hypothetical protein FJ029_09920 [Actinobacteria bacterium]|nr:hypothetical protein [Actinomycetota bacterium]